LAEGVHPRIHGGTRTAGIIGWPVDHSLSPVVHNAAFAATDLDWVYVPLPVAPGALPDALAGLVATGFAGANVTMPHKTETAERAHHLSEDARRLGAVNTLVVEDGRLHGHNTDVGGFDRFLRRDAGFDPAGRSVLVYGAGGAARAATLAVVRGGAASVAVAVREPARALDLQEALADLSGDLRILPLEDARGVEADLVVNATPVGAAGDALPLPSLGSETLVVDLLYHPSVTPLIARAREAGASAFGGLGLLLHQAALSFELWTGTPAPLDVMSAAALAELADRG
jgi:shikimate dehydrogenase